MSNERKSIFITGAASGMGRATALHFTRNNWFVGVYDVNEPGLETLAAEIGAENCHATRLDVSDRAAYQAVLKEFDDKAGGRLDLLYNNAGIIKGDLFGEMDFADINAVIQVNLMGVVNGIHSAYPLLKKTPNSLCFTTCSSSAIIGSPGLATYSTTKHAVKGLTEALSIELALVDSRAADTLPGHIDTDMMTPEYRKRLPEEGMWRPLPVQTIADVVWAAYHDDSGKIHWYVPEELEELEKYVTADIERVRDGSKKNFDPEVFKSTMKKDE